MMRRNEVVAGAVPEKQLQDRDEVEESHGRSKRRRSSMEQLHGKRNAARQDEAAKKAAVKAEPAAPHDEDDVHEDTVDVDEDQEGDEGEEDTEDEEGEEEQEEEEEEEEEGDGASMQEGPVLPAGATLSPLAQHALRVVEDSWPHPQASKQDEEEELGGPQLLGMARLAWSKAGEQEQMASKLARALVDTAEAHFLVRCLTLSRFSRLFAWMSAARAAASSAAALIAAAQDSARRGDAAAAAAALGSASEVAAAGSAASGGGGPGSSLHPAARAAAAAAVEAADLVLAPRCCLEARLKLASLLALDPAHQQDLGTVEALLVSALEVAEAAQEVAGTSLDLEDDLQLPGSSSSCSLKLRSLEVLTKATLGKLCMLLCQEGRDSEARGFLLALSYRYRLSRGVLHYHMPAAATSNSDQARNGRKGADPGRNQQQQQQQQPEQQEQQHTQLPQHLSGQKRDVASSEAPACYVQAVDGALPHHMLQLMRANFSPASPFWSQHGYNQDSPYFSYVHPLDGQHRSAMDQVISHIHGVACRHFPRVAEARYAEWWAHCRPHGSGHQMHFDSDNEGVGEVRNPIISTVLYLTGGGIGGPTLVTDQAFSSTRLASRGWLVHPEAGRLTMFDGSVLHGVIPGRGPSPRPGECRVTFMVAFWRDIRTRPRADGLPGASQPFPLLRGSCQGTAPGAAAGAAAAGQAAPPGAAAAAAAPGSTSADALQHSGEECDSLPGPESFGSSLLPSWQHTWQEAFPLQHGPEWVAQGGRAEAPSAAATCTRVKDTTGAGTTSAGMTASLAGQLVAPLLVAPAEVMPVWEEVDPRACHAKGYALDQLKGLPAYKLCFQGF